MGTMPLSFLETLGTREKGAKMKRRIAVGLTALLLVFCLLLPVQGAVKYKTYRNARFGYSVKYPSYLKQDGPLPANGDGISMAGKKASLAVWGSFNVGFTPASYLAMSSEGKTVSSMKSTRKYCEFTAKEGKYLVYQYALFAKEKIAGFRLTYPKSQRSTYKPILSKMKKSLGF